MVIYTKREYDRLVNRYGVTVIREIEQYLTGLKSTSPLTLTSTAQKFGVTRQVIRVLTAKLGLAIAFPSVDVKITQPKGAVKVSEIYFESDSLTRQTKESKGRAKSKAQPETKDRFKRIPADKRAYLKKNATTKSWRTLSRETRVSIYLVRNFLESEGFTNPRQRKTSV